MRISSRNPWMRLLALVTVLVVLAVAWYLISPLFIDMEVSEAFPTLAHMPTKTARAQQTQAALANPTETPQNSFDVAQATAAMQEAMAEDPSQAADPMPDNGGAVMQILVQGEFYDIAHEGHGVATIYELADGNRILRFENFEVLNGPQLHVYLAPQSSIPDTIGVELEGSYDLGAPKGNIGDQNYDIPADLNIEDYQSVVIWCVPFRVPFNAAPLSPQ